LEEKSVQQAWIKGQLVEKHPDIHKEQGYGYDRPEDRWVIVADRNQALAPARLHIRIVPVLLDRTVWRTSWISTRMGKRAVSLEWSVDSI
jgi:hypothetical protein